MSTNHWMMFSTFAEQRYFSYPEKESYEGIIINANMASHAPEGLASFVVEKTANRKYLIDPITHAFQHDPDFIKDNEDEVKKSIAALAAAFGGVISREVGKRPLLPSDWTATEMEKLAKACSEFQLNHIAQRMKGSDSAKYDLDGQDSTFAPEAIIAPYFYMQEATIDKWLRVNLELLKITKQSNDGRKVYAEIVISRSLLVNDEKMKQMTAAYAEASADGFVIWVDNLDESEAGTPELNALTKLAQALNGGKRFTLNLHGGFFSILTSGSALKKRAFSAVCHGPEFGEHRSVVPVGGGIPIPKFYVPDLHVRLRYREALSLFKALGFLRSSSLFHGSVCNCRECNDTISGNPDNFVLFGLSNSKLVQRGRGMATAEYPTAETKMRCLRHYLQRKHVEYEDFTKWDQEACQKHLKASGEKYMKALGVGGVSHLETWGEVIKKMDSPVAI